MAPNHNDDLLDQALQALRETPIPAEPPADTLKAVLAAAPAGTTWAHRLKNVKRLTKIAAAFILTVGIISLIIITGPQDQSRPDFNRIVQPLLAARTATFKVTFDIEGLPVQTHEGMFMDPAFTHHTGSDESVFIMDFNQSKMLTLATTQKIATVFEWEKPPEKLGNFFEIRDILRQAQKNEPAWVEFLGEQQIAGQNLLGYRIKQPLMDMILWADADNLRPVRVESILDMEDKTGRVVIHDVNLDVDLRKSLFSLQPPENYVVYHRKIGLSGSREEYLAQLVGMTGNIPVRKFSAPINITAVKEFFNPLKRPLKELADKQQVPPVMALMAVRRIIIL